MAVEGGAKCIKYLMFFFNFIFFILGIAIIVGGALTLTLYQEYVQFTGNSGTAIPITLIAVGVFIFLTGFFGCCGAVKENYCMLGTYSTIMVLLLILELAAGIAGYVLRDDIDKEIETNMKDLQVNYNMTGPSSTKELFDSMQENLKCCGVDNSTDWIGWNTSAPGTVPESCCVEDTVNCNVIGDDLNVYSEGCYPALKDKLLNNIGIIAGVAIGIAVVEIFGIVFACCLMRAIKSEYEVV